MTTATTAKRGEKAKPKSKAGAWDRPGRNASHTKAGSGRKAMASASKAPRTAVAPEPRKKLRANIGRKFSAFVGVYLPRRVWREGEPVHIVKPVRAARVAAEKAKAAS